VSSTRIIGDALSIHQGLMQNNSSKNNFNKEDVLKNTAVEFDCFCFFILFGITRNVEIIQSTVLHCLFNTQKLNYYFVFFGKRER
jgi:hypothetical protein